MQLEIPKRNIGMHFDIPAFGMWAWDFQKKHDRFNKEFYDETLKHIEHSIDAGMDCYATPSLIAKGLVERAVGNAIVKTDRKKMFIIAKVDIDYPHYYDAVNAVIYTLKRMKVSYIDLCLIELKHPLISFRHCMDAMNELVKTKKIRHLGAVNFTLDQLSEANYLLTQRMNACLVNYNLIDREPEENGLYEYCRDNHMFLIAKDPFKRGLLTQKGKYPVLDEVCKQYKMTQAQAAVNWLLFHPHVITLSNITRAAHIAEDAKAVSMEMEGDDYEKLGRSFM